MTDKDLKQLHPDLAEQLEIEDEIDHKQTDDRPVVPLAGVIYGDTIYWLTIVAAVVTLIGQMVSFVTQNNHVQVSYLLSAIWQGKKVEDIWVNAVGATPDGHWYLDHIWAGDGLTTFGIALGVFGVIPAILGSSVILFRQRQRLFGALALIAALITIAAMNS